MKTIAGYHAPSDPAPPPGMGKGYVPRDYKSFPLGALQFAKAAPPIKSLSDSEIMAAIPVVTVAKSWPKDQCDRVGLKVKNQQNSSYCWVHGATRSCEIAYVFSGEHSFLPLAAFDVGALIKGGRNQGGSGVEAIEVIARDGICTEALHKPMDFDSSRSPEQAASAAMHKIEAFDDLDCTDHQLIASYIINGIGVTVGIPAWGHEVCITFLVIEGSTWYFGFDNSWGESYGDNGRGVLHGAMSRFDEAGAVRIMSPSAT